MRGKAFRAFKGKKTCCFVTTNQGASPCRGGQLAATAHLSAHPLTNSKKCLAGRGGGFSDARTPKTRAESERPLKPCRCASCLALGLCPNKPKMPSGHSVQRFSELLNYEPAAPPLKGATPPLVHSFDSMYPIILKASCSGIHSDIPRTAETCTSLDFKHLLACLILRGFLQPDGSIAQ